jgi:maleate isomerase
MKPLTNLVAEYIEAEGIEVQDYVALEITDNLAVAAQDPGNLVDIYKRLSLKNIDALVLSACVQMPSLSAVQRVEDECSIPVLSASIATTYQMLNRLGLEARVPGCGALLSGTFTKAA